MGKESIDRSSSFGRQLDNLSTTDANSLTAVVYGMVQARKKTTLGSSLSVPTKDRQPGQSHSQDSSPTKSSSPTSSTGGQRGRLSVTFSLRRKSHKSATGGHKLQRIASENPHTIQKKRQQQQLLDTQQQRQQQLLEMESASMSIPRSAVISSTSCHHSSPDVRGDQESTTDQNRDRDQQTVISIEKEENSACSRITDEIIIVTGAEGTAGSCPSPGMDDIESGDHRQVRSVSQSR